MRRISERVDSMYEDHSQGRRYVTAVRLFDSVDKLDKVASAATVANKDSDSMTADLFGSNLVQNLTEYFTHGS